MSRIGGSRLSRVIESERRRMARPAGFEPAAFGSGGQRSIQLSYGRLRTMNLVAWTFGHCNLALNEAP
jgi:hypothetical protein